MTIYKYQLTTEGYQQIPMPADARILSLDTQRGVPCIWALIDRSAPLVYRIFRTFGTGHPVAPEEIGAFVGTYQIEGGALVFHVFEAAP